MRIGRYRVRVSHRWCESSNLFVDRARFDEGDVYRLRVGRLMFKAMVDRMSDRDRLMCEQSTRELLEWL